MNRPGAGRYLHEKKDGYRASYLLFGELIEGSHNN